MEKVKIEAYEDPQFQNKLEEGEFTASVNPEGYSYTYTVEYEDNQTPGSSASQAQFNRIKPRVIELELLFDKTGAVPGTLGSQDREERATKRAEGVVPELDAFKDLVVGYKGDLHRPPYLIIGWGTLLFKGVLVDLNLNYKLFLPDGTPLRAIAKIKVQEIVEEEARVREENDESADITHQRVVRESDRLDHMAFRIYKDPSYYIQVAQANQLVNFRALKTGETLRFPPVKKE